MFDSENIAQLAWREAAFEAGYDLPLDVFQSVLGRNLPSYRDELVEALGEEFPLEAVYQRKQVMMDKYISERRLPVKDGLIDLLEVLERYDLLIAIASSSPGGIIERNVSSAGLSINGFDAYVGGDEVQNSKPAPDIFLLAAQKLGIRSESCLVIEDSNPGVQAAHSAGMPVIMVPDLMPPTILSQDIAFRILPSLHSVLDLIEDSAIN